MKKIFTLLLFIVLVAGGLQLSAQAKRTALIEESTSATCPPCAATNPILLKYLQPYGNKVIKLAYQCYIPSVGDPMYASNTTEVTTRLNYYGIASAPNARLDGLKFGASSHPIELVNDPSILDTRLDLESPIEITVDHIIMLGTAGAKDSMDITVRIKNVSASDFSNANYVLHTVIVEEQINFVKQAATNGETEFHTVMRKMLPSAAGTKITDVIAPGATKTVTFRAAVPTYTYSYKEIAVLAFVQNNTASSKEVIQAALSEPKVVNGVYYDLAITAGKPNGRVDNCDNTVGYDLTITNLSTGTDTIKSIDIIPYVNGGAKTKSTWTGVLLPGGTVTHKVGNQTMPVGNSTLNVAIDKINAGTIKDLNLINNFQSQSVFTTYNSAVAGTEIKQNFEAPIGTGAPPKTLLINEGIRIFKIDSSIFAFNGVNPPVGVSGFGNSRYSLLYYFMDGGVAGLSSSIIFDKVDLTNSKNTKISWSYAYTTKDGNSSDKMEVLVSKDCGATWTSVYEKQGEDLKTCDPDPSRYHYPGIYNAYPEDWKIEGVDLSAYDGTPELNIRFKGTGGNGQGYFLDDVNVAGGAPNATNDPGILKSLNVSPNPATDHLVIKLNVEENANATISLSDMSGRVVSSTQKNLFGGYNQFSIPVNQTSGIYILEVKTEKGVRTEKVSIF
ncbi:MAG: T9SS type A sorting domain-containing protein [Saprospiraceae bacterium]